MTSVFANVNYHISFRPVKSHSKQIPEPQKAAGMKVVLDTNILLVSFSSKSEHYWIWTGLLEGQFTLCVTTDILLEYEEVIARHASPAIAHNVLDAITDLPNLDFVTKYIFWQLIEQDPDDNKFVDVAIAASADFLVTNDRHFQLLQQLPFPRVLVVSFQTFLAAI